MFYSHFYFAEPNPQTKENMAGKQTIQLFIMLYCLIISITHTFQKKVYAIFQQSVCFIVALMNWAEHLAETCEQLRIQRCNIDPREINMNHTFLRDGNTELKVKEIKNRMFKIKRIRQYTYYK